MKPDAPEKIYINGFSCFAVVPVKEGVEYIRTDAFIEKACEWLRHYVNPTAGTYLFDEDIEKFINYMKGE